MTESVKKTDLLVFEYGGSARSGKGTIVEHLTNTRPEVAKDETGLYYRKLTSDFLKNGTINTSMTSQEVISLLSTKSPEELTGMLAERDKWGDGEPRKELYRDDVNKMVADIGQVHNARLAVKGGFADRIKSLVKAGDKRAVAIDGRHLSGIVKEIEGARMILRTFVDCQPFEAALRECSRNGIKLTDPSGQKILESIELRNFKDRTRGEDPMAIDADAIDFWQDSEVESEALILRQCQTTRDYLSLVDGQRIKYGMEVLPRGIGHLAASNGRQIFFDTTPFRLFENPVEAMLTAADQMFNEAIESNP